MNIEDKYLTIWKFCDLLLYRGVVALITKPQVNGTKSMFNHNGIVMY